MLPWRDSNFLISKTRVGEEPRGRMGEGASQQVRPLPTHPFAHSPIQFVFESLSLISASDGSEANVDLVSLMLPLIPFAVITEGPPFPI
jgi:hypothetical protein